MRIKELEDVLALVDELPVAYQIDCVHALMFYIDSWEQQASEGVVDHLVWARIRDKRAEGLRAQIQRELKERAKRKPP